MAESMQIYAMENDLPRHPQRMLIPIFELENGSILTEIYNLL